ncbi:MAG: phosphotransferase [Anaerolineales bacterium]|nr:phosphotransferase [Anaerolineales bacterium]
MQSTFITQLTQVTPEWLTHALTTSGALTAGAVEAIEVETGRGNWSANARLKVRYSADAHGARPERLFLKMVQADLGDDFFGASEVNYYRRDYVGVGDAPLLRCYSAAYSEAERRYYLLLDDVTETHVEAAAKTPTFEYGLALAEGLAALHAHHWATPPQHSAAHILRFADMAEQGLSHILQHHAAVLQPHWPEFLRTFFAHHPPKMLARTSTPNGFTLIHGDVGHNNILVPREGMRPIFIIDRQPFDWSLTTWLGVYDLAYAMVLDWEIETRRQLEVPVLKHYHASLLQRGVKDYAWEQLWDDYRLCVAMGIYIAVEYCRGSGAELVNVWLPMLQRALTACDDLQCGELWRN